LSFEIGAAFRSRSTGEPPHFLPDISFIRLKVLQACLLTVFVCLAFCLAGKMLLSSFGFYCALLP
jgi:hypothetical protein